MTTQTADNAASLANSIPHPAPATSIKERKCVVCPRAIPIGEMHVYNGDTKSPRRWHAECYKKEKRDGR